MLHYNKAPKTSTT